MAVEGVLLRRGLLEPADGRDEVCAGGSLCRAGKTRPRPGARGQEGVVAHRPIAVSFTAERASSDHVARKATPGGLGRRPSFVVESRVERRSDVAEGH